MRSNEVREYALERGAFILIYPPAMPRILPAEAHAQMIAGLQQIFGLKNWPSLG